MFFHCIVLYAASLFKGQQRFLCHCSLIAVSYFNGLHTNTILDVIIVTVYATHKVYNRDNLSTKGALIQDVHLHVCCCTSHHFC